MTIVAFVYLAKRLFDGIVVLNLKKRHLTSINGKKKFKRILVEGEKFKLRKLPSRDFIALFSSRRRACLVLKHNRVSEVFKGFNGSEVQKNTGRRQKVQVTKAAFKGLHRFVFFTAESLPCSETQPSK